jgi:hypothetical protein
MVGSVHERDNGRKFAGRAAAERSKIAAALSADHPARVAAKTVIVAQVERLHWRIWNGKAKNARKSIDHIRAVMSHFQGEAGGRNAIARSRKLWTALHALDGYLTSQSAWLANYAERHRAGWRVGTALNRRDGQFPGEPPDE